MQIETEPLTCGACDSPEVHVERRGEVDAAGVPYVEIKCRACGETERV